jgi:hypothetical protein
MSRYTVVRADSFIFLDPTIYGFDVDGYAVELLEHEDDELLSIYASCVLARECVEN